ncbi:hypothetical protein LZ32DRAFT_454565 [Colletotrichum eremochloae]|nr:hypothetical protein LZ32DRAFT_454565 [Colletotrichum eremochloae]
MGRELPPIDAKTRTNGWQSGVCWQQRRSVTVSIVGVENQRSSKGGLYVSFCTADLHKYLGRYLGNVETACWYVPTRPSQLHPRLGRRPAEGRWLCMVWLMSHALNSSAFREQRKVPFHCLVGIHDYLHMMEKEKHQLARSLPSRPPSISITVPIIPLSPHSCAQLSNRKVRSRPALNIRTTMDEETNTAAGAGDSPEVGQGRMAFGLSTVYRIGSLWPMAGLCLSAPALPAGPHPEQCRA